MEDRQTTTTTRMKDDDIVRKIKTEKFYFHHCTTFLCGWARLRSIQDDFSLKDFEFPPTRCLWLRSVDVELWLLLKKQQLNLRLLSPSYTTHSRFVALIKTNFHFSALKRVIVTLKELLVFPFSYINVSNKSARCAAIGSSPKQLHGSLIKIHENDVSRAAQDARDGIEHGV